jgi:Tol biopolymer transport system component
MSSLITAAVAAVLLILSTSVGIAQEVMTPERLWQLKRAAAPVVSPSGRDVALTITEYDIESNTGRTDLFVLSADGRAAPRPLTQLGRVSSPQWRPDGRRIGFLATQSDETQLWEVSPDGTDLRQVSRIEGGIANFRYAPTGTHVSFTRRVQVDETLAQRHPDLPSAQARVIDRLMYRHWDRWHDGRYNHLFVASYDDGTLGEPRSVMPGDARYDTPLPPFGGVEQINWSPDGSRIAYTAKALTGARAARSTNSDIYLYTLATGRTVNLTERNPGYDVEPVFSRDGRYLAWLSMERDGYESDRNRLFVHDFTTGQSRELTAGFDLDAHSPQWSPTGEIIFFTSETAGTIQIYEVTLGGRVRQVTEGSHDYGSFGVANDDGTLLIASRTSMSAPCTASTWRPARPFASLTSTRPCCSPSPWAAWSVAFQRQPTVRRSIAG